MVSKYGWRQLQYLYFEKKKHKINILFISFCSFAFYCLTRSGLALKTIFQFFGLLITNLQWRTRNSTHKLWILFPIGIRCFLIECNKNSWILNRKLLPFFITHISYIFRDPNRIEMAGRKKDMLNNKDCSRPWILFVDIFFW
jgi:hypothetical protein